MPPYGGTGPGGSGSGEQEARFLRQQAERLKQQKEVSTELFI